MLRLFPKRCTVALTASQLAGRMQPSFGARKAEQTTILDIPTPEEDGQWPASLFALRTYLAGLEPGPCELAIVLSDRFFQFVLVPWSDRISRVAEKEKLARIQLELTFGTSAKDAVKIGDAGYGESAIACAMDSRLIRELADIASERSIVINSVVPHFMSAFNRWRRRVGQDGVFVVCEPDHCTMLYVRNAAPVALRTFRLLSSEPSDISRLLDREMLLLDVSEHVPVYCHGRPAAELKLRGPNEVVHLQLPDLGNMALPETMLHLEEA